MHHTRLRHRGRESAATKIGSIFRRHCGPRVVVRPLPPSLRNRPEQAIFTRVRRRGYLVASGMPHARGLTLGHAVGIFLRWVLSRVGLPPQWARVLAALPRSHKLPEAIAAAVAAHRTLRIGAPAAALALPRGPQPSAVQRAARLGTGDTAMLCEGNDPWSILPSGPRSGPKMTCRRRLGRAALA